MKGRYVCPTCEGPITYIDTDDPWGKHPYCEHCKLLVSGGPSAEHAAKWIPGDAWEEPMPWVDPGKPEIIG